MARRLGNIGRLQLNVTVGLLLVLVGVVVVLLYSLLPIYREDLVFFTALVGGLAVVHTAYYAATQLRENVERDKMCRSFAIAEAIGAIDMVDVRVFAATKLSDKALSREQVYNLIFGDDAIHGSVRRLLGILEDASIAVQYGYADEVTLERSIGYLVTWAQTTFQPYLEEVRSKSGKSGASLYVELDKLANAWRSRKYLTDGTTFTVPSA